MADTYGIDILTGLPYLIATDGEPLPEITPTTGNTANPSSYVYGTDIITGEEYLITIDDAPLPVIVPTPENSAIPSSHTYGIDIVTGEEYIVANTLDSLMGGIEVAIEAKGVDVPVGTSYLDYPQKINEIKVSGWKRPEFWPLIPAIQSGENVIYGVYAIYEFLDAINENVVNFYTVTAGDSIVNWGDGNTETIRGIDVSTHIYNYSTIDIPSYEGVKYVLISIRVENATIIAFQIDDLLLTSSINIVELVINAPAITTGNLIIGGSTTSKSTKLRSFYLYENNIDNFSNILAKNYLLENVGYIDCSKATTTKYLFGYCYNLKYVSNIITSSLLTDASYTFYYCYSLIEAPYFETINVNTMYQMFFYNYNIKIVPKYNTISVKNMSYMFTSCASLEQLPDFETPEVTTISSFVNGCSSLIKFPNINTSKVTAIANTFMGCFNILYIPTIDLSSQYVSIGITNIKTLKRLLITNLSASINIMNCGLNSIALNEVYSNLLIVEDKFITVTGNPGIGGDDTSIATAKGWTVVG